MLQLFSQFLSLLLGVLLATLGIKGFLLPSHFIDGGVTGISMLISNLTALPLGTLILLFNLPFLFLGYLQIGRIFFWRSIFAIALFSISLALMQIPSVTTDKLLTSVFGGIFLGAGIGLSIRGGGVLDGTEILALVLSKRAGLRVGQVILALNVLVFSSAAIFLGIEPALYSVLTYVSATKTVDFLLHGIEEYYSFFIISGKAEAIRNALIHDTGRGVTTLKGQGGKSNEEIDILYCVVTRLEISRIKNIVAELDEQAFVVIAHVSDVAGGIVRKPTVERLIHQAV